MAPQLSEPLVAPRWVRAVDLVCLLFVIVAGIVAMSGGFRLHIGGLRIAVTSPYPLLLWALGIGLVRHFSTPTAPVYRDLPPRIIEWWRRPGVSTAATVIAGTRPAILLVGYLAVFVFGYAGGSAPLRHFDNELANLPVRWDAGWYLQIVTNGYSYVPGDPELQQNIVFFPAYPMLVRGVGRLLGGRLLGYTWGGLLLSVTAFFAALVYLYALARETLGEDEARFTLWLIAAYPFALFFGAVYTESLFLLCAAAAFYHFTKGHYGWAAVWGLLIGLTRPNGFELSLPLALLAVMRSRYLFPERFEGARGHHVKALAAAAMPCVGMLIYAAFIWNLTGNPLAWVAGHVAWGRRYEGLVALVGARYNIIASEGVGGYVASLPLDVLNGLGVMFVLVTAWPVARRLGLAYAVFLLINILPPLAAGGLVSAGRFSSVLFPSFIWLAGAVPARHRAGWIATFAAIQALNAALFYTWRPLY